MITWFDRLRGSAQGRCEPVGFTAPDGQHVFVLGGDNALESAVLQGGDASVPISGDYTEITQVVDLADWDLVAATMDTIGVLMGQAQPAPGFPSDYPALWHFNYDIGLPTARNLVSGGFGMTDVGNIEVANESYSPVLTRCRKVPVLSSSAQLVGANTPQWFPAAPLDNYTFQMWVDFDGVAHPTSWGVSPNLFSCVDGAPNGFAASLQGAFGPGAHSWMLQIAHHYGATTGSIFPGFTWDTPNPEWTLLTVTWDRFAAPWDRLLLYINGSVVPVLPFAIAVNSPIAAAPATPIYCADPNLWGMLDEMRMLDVTLTPAEIAASYVACTSMPTPIDYAWRMQIIINAEVYAERVIAPDEQRRWTDFKAPVRNLSGPAEVKFRLILEEV